MRTGSVIDGRQDREKEGRATEAVWIACLSQRCLDQVILASDTPIQFRAPIS
jgi:hypothetical protein